METQKGYINIDGFVPVFWCGLLSILALTVSAPFIAYSQWKEHKEEKQLIADCERNLPREQHCVIVKAAKQQGEVK